MNKTINGHVLYTPEDFTAEEYRLRNSLARYVIDQGLAICKKCGAAESELDDGPCVRGYILCAQCNTTKVYLKPSDEEGVDQLCKECLG